MSAYSSALPTTVPRPTAYGAQVANAVPAAPAGTFAPGTKIQVGGHRVVIQKYFSEGGFAHVYLVKMPKPIDGTDIAVLKRVAVADKENLANMKTEVETMKKLKGHRPIVTYYDSHASRLQPTGFEVFLLMEFCNGGGLIDFMNTRLQNRLTEPEILKIFSDVAEGVACMHYLQPPLLHRDIKVENVLITSDGTSRRFKLCDFGSTAPPRPAATNGTECRLIEDDIQRHTTLQYRSPEMVDVYRKQPIDEKSDIWALGVLLYKLCYYTTPFEAQGQLAILNASFKFPATPRFSDKLKRLIAYMLKENPRSRPNIYQVLREACLMQNIRVPIKDIYTARTESESRRNEKLPVPKAEVTSPESIGATIAVVPKARAVVPEVVPMRRGRPTTTPAGVPNRTSVTPARAVSSDPFAALDGKPGAEQEIASRFPSLDQFSLLHDKSGKFEFATTPTAAAATNDVSLNKRVTDRLADDAFVSPPPANVTPSAAQKSSTQVTPRTRNTPSNASYPAVSASAAVSLHQPTPTRPPMVSQGTMTSPSPPSTDFEPQKFDASPVQEASAIRENHTRSSSLPRGPVSNRLSVTQFGSSPKSSGFLQPGASTVYRSSSRPADKTDLENPEPIVRARSSESRTRPTSTHVESSVEYLRDRESAASRPRYLQRQRSSQDRPTPDAAVAVADVEDSGTIESNVEFLRTMEEQEDSKKKDRRRSSGEKARKRSSMPSMSLSGSKTLLAGKFGDAFKRFESNRNPEPSHDLELGPRTPSPRHDMLRKDLTPIAGSEATDGRSDNGEVLDEEDDLPPEQRRELERRRLSIEERRVAQAAAEYRQRLAARAPGGPAPKSAVGEPRALSIQNKVKSLLDESQQSSPVKKTAEGYGRYTSHGAALEHTASAPATTNPFPRPGPMISRKPVMMSSTGRTQDYHAKPQPPPPQPLPDIHPSMATNNNLARTATLPSRAARPSAPPKPTHLNSTTTGPQFPRSSTVATSISTSTSNRTLARSINAERTAPVPRPKALRPVARPDMTPAEKDDYLADFSKRFPSLSGIEMVETSIGVGNGNGNAMSNGPGNGDGAVVNGGSGANGFGGGRVTGSDPEQEVRTREV